MRSTVVFEISDGMIKLLQAGGLPKRMVMAADALKIDQFSDDQISQKLLLWVRQLRINLRDAYVVVLVPRSEVILRHMSLPTHNDKELQAMVELQLVNHIPYAREEVEIGYQVQAKSPDGYSKVVVAVIPCEKAMRFWNIFNAARIPVNSMTVSSVGLWLWYQQQMVLPGKMGGVIDLNSHSSEICICRKEYWLNSREIPIGAAMIRGEGLGEFIKQWELTMANISKEGGIGAAGTLFLVSWVMLPAELKTALAKLQGCTIKEVELMRELPLAKNIVLSKTLMQEQVSLAALAGIALGPSTPLVDLMPRSVRDQQQKGKLRQETIFCLVWLLAALIMYTAAVSMSAIKKNLELAHLRKDIEQISGQATKVEEQIQQVNHIEGVLRRRAVFAQWAEEVYRVMPPHVSLVNLEIENKNILIIQGISSNSGEINQLQKALIDSPVFSEVNLGFVNKRSSQGGDMDYFKITCAIGHQDETNEKIK